MNRYVSMLIGFACLLVAPGVGARTSSDFRETWGDLAVVAGRSAVSDTGMTKTSWYWIEPGRVLKQEYRRAKDDVLYRESVIRLGSEPGTFSVATQPVGMAAEPVYVGYLQADGRIFMNVGARSPDWGFMVEGREGGAELVYSAARFSNGSVVANDADDRKYTRFLLEPPAAGVVAEEQLAPREPAVAPSHPRAAAAQVLLEKLIGGFFSGELPVGDMTDRLRSAVESPRSPRPPVWLGAPGEARLQWVSDEGKDFRFLVDHANGQVEWVVNIEADSDRIHNFAWEPLPPFRVRPIAVGEEVSGFLQHGVTGRYGPDIPVAAYRFVGEQGQRICARVGSVEAYTHVFLAESLDPSASPLYSSWLPPYEDYATPKAPWNRSQGTSFMATLPKTGEYVLYVMAHGQGTEKTYSGKEIKKFKIDLPAPTDGYYALKLWDADAPEPGSVDPELVRTQHPDAADGTWLGNIAHLVGKPHVGFENPIAVQFERVDGKLVQHQLDIETGKVLPDWVFAPTGRRGEFRLQKDGRLLQVQCDGNWTLAGKSGVLRFGLYGGGGMEQRIEYHGVGAGPPYRYPTGKRAPFTYVDTWLLLNDKNVAETLDYQYGKRDLERQNAARRAQNAAEDRANQAAMMRGILGGFARGLAEANADQQYAQDQFEAAVSRGQQQGFAIRRAQQASDALARMASAGASKQVPPPSVDPGGEPDAGPAERKTPPPASLPDSSSAARECEVVTKTYTNRSLPKPSTAEAGSYIDQLPSMCAMGVEPVRGALACSEESEAVVVRDEKGIPRVTGRRTMYTCEAVMTCPPAEVCKSQPGGGGSVQ